MSLELQLSKMHVIIAVIVGGEGSVEVLEISNHILHIASEPQDSGT